MSPFVLSILSVTAVSLISLAGVASLLLKRKQLRNLSKLLISLAAGSLLGDVWFHIVPELFSAEATIDLRIIGALVLTGILGFWLLEVGLEWYHCHEDSDESTHWHPVAAHNLIADAIHNFVDGLLIAGSFAAGPEIGVATTVAVLLHEIPQEIGDFGILIHSGLRPKLALLFNLLSAFTAIVGTLVGWIVITGLEDFSKAALAFTAGGLLYIAVADILPQVKHREKLIEIIPRLALILFGMLIMAVLTFLE
jgi:zinc and cadmium transporter